MRAGITSSVAQPIRLAHETGQAVELPGGKLSRGHRDIARGILESRSVTEATIATDLDWSASEVLGQNASADVELRQGIIAAMGALYGSMHHTTMTGEGFNLGERLRPGLRSLGVLAGHAPEKCDRIIDQYMLTANELDTLVDTTVMRARALIYKHSFD